MVTHAGGKPSQSTLVLSQPRGSQAGITTLNAAQPGGKPSQSTLVLAQPRGSQAGITTVTAAQLSQGLKTVQTGKTKGGPVYARIITPPPGIRLAAVRPGQVAGTQVSSIQGMSVIQALQSDAAQILSQVPVGSVTTTSTPSTPDSSKLE